MRLLALLLLSAVAPRALATGSASISLLSHLAKRASIDPLDISALPATWSRWGDGQKGWALPDKDQNAWIPVTKVRGVNLGGFLILEPWQARDTWAAMGCAQYDCEWECNEAKGLAEMQPKWENHWATFYSEQDFEQMKALGLNTIRIPLGYWIVDALIGADPFASGGMHYLKQVLRWARANNLYAILDLHGSPGSQTVRQSFTGHTVDQAGFFTTANYQKAWDCLTNLTIMSHLDPDFSNVVMLQVLNEPLQSTETDLTSVFYPMAQQAIRDAERQLGVTCLGIFPDCLAIQFMSTSWGSGDPSQHLKLPDWDHIAYDDHNYAGFIVKNATREAYLEYLCTNNRSTEMRGPVITGEWSLSTAGGGELDPSSPGAQQFFEEYAAAAISNAEKGAGWIFWSWSTQLKDSTKALWGYRDAVQAGYIPKDLDTIDRTICNRYS
ncbi:glycoside hydrolase family 5 protein [Sporobolomyces koalae]|uniref:glycoside hydrolase family 5 protein n=1 Tax=Sporobolomyces koalae TaxID=500713 RepID=UPI00316F7D54